MEFLIEVTNQSHYKYAETICNMMEDAAKIRGTGIAKRKPDYIRKKIGEGKAVIALIDSTVIGFCYIENWEGHKYVAHSGLIVHPEYRKTGLAKLIKKEVFELSRKKFPNSKIFGITTSMAVMKINSELGYKPVTFSELTQDLTFWSGCESCSNFDILQRTQKSMCLCTGMICEAEEKTENKSLKSNGIEVKKNSWENFTRFLKHRKLRIQRKATQFPLINKLINHE